MKGTLAGQTRASGIGTQKQAYLQLLLDICAAGVVLDRISVDSTGWGSILMQYTVSGTESELETFRRRVNGRN